VGQRAAPYCRVSTAMPQGQVGLTAADMAAPPVPLEDPDRPHGLNRWRPAQDVPAVSSEFGGTWPAAFV
jgi:hypothetical protein